MNQIYEKKPKICLACNGGGHFEHLRKATKDLSEEQFDIYWITDKAKFLKNVLSEKRHYSFYNPAAGKLYWGLNALQAIWYLIKERPNVVISTGAGVAFPTMFFGKYLFGCKLIFLCSAANVTKPSRVPYKAYPISDLFLVQWPEMKAIFPNAKYIGVL